MHAQQQAVKRDRRKHLRHKLQGRPYVVLGDHKDKMGNMIDISEGGLCFYYKAEDERLKFQDKLDIFVLGSNLQLTDVQYTVVFEYTVKNSAYDIHKRIRRCGVEFLRLSSEQRAVLNTLIHTHTAGNA